MTVSYQQILHDTALRMNALVGSQVATLATTYDTASLTVANFKSADFPFNSFRDAILMAVGDYVLVIAATPNHPWQSRISSITVSPIANGTALSAELGVLSIRDTVDNTQLTEQPLEVVQRIVRETWRTYPLYYYKVSGGILYHTRAAVAVQSMLYNRTTELAQFAAGNMVLPDVLETAVMARAISLMVKNTQLEDKAGIYRKYSEEVIADIRAGYTSINPLPSAVPTIAPTAG